jgi:DNA helicase HerA-like ATPase
MTDSSAAKELTETFLTIIRQQRHLGVRTIISTQEPTISPKLIDLCSITFIHRFTSPQWYSVLRSHIPIEKGNDKNEHGMSDGLYRIANLRTGEALVFAHSAQLVDKDRVALDTKHEVFRLKVRKRITWDGGRTIVCIR